MKNQKLMQMMLFELQMMNFDPVLMHGFKALQDPEIIMNKLI